MILAIAAGLLLFMVGMRIYSVGHETGGDVSLLNHEHDALTFLTRFQAANRSFQDYRMAVVLQGPSSAEPLGRHADAAIADVTKFEKTSSNSFDLSTEWKNARSAWRVFRAHPQVDNNAVVFGRRLIVAVDQLEETSTLTYDPSISAQNLADVSPSCRGCLKTLTAQLCLLTASNNRSE